MLQPTLTTLITDTRLRPDAIAFCPQTGANLIRSHAQYVLIARSDTVYRCWSRRKVKSDQDAIARAKKALERLR